MVRKVGQIIAVLEPTWMTRIPLARDPETKQRNYNNRAIHAFSSSSAEILWEKDHRIEEPIG